MCECWTDTYDRPYFMLKSSPSLLLSVFVRSMHSLAHIRYSRSLLYTTIQDVRTGRHTCIYCFPCTYLSLSMHDRISFARVHTVEHYSSTGLELPGHARQGKGKVRLSSSAYTIRHSSHRTDVSCSWTSLSSSIEVPGTFDIDHDFTAHPQVRYTARLSPSLILMKFYSYAGAVSAFVFITLSLGEQPSHVIPGAL